MGVDTHNDSIHLSLFTLGTWQSYLPSGGKLACVLYLAAVKDRGGKMGGRKLFARLDTALALFSCKRLTKVQAVACDVWWEGVATYAIPHSLMLTCFNCVKAYLTSFRKVSHKHPVGCRMSIERLEGKTEVGSWWN